MVAHLHHAWENYHALGKTREGLIQVICGSLFQFTYTTIFGWYASYLFIKTGNLWPPVLCHSFCNIMGFPDFSRITYNKQGKLITNNFIIIMNTNEEGIKSF